MAARGKGREATPVRITTAPTSSHDDIVSRRRRYTISMSIRVVCFIAAILTTGWVRWVLVLGAIVLPYVAVVLANARTQRVEGSDLVTPHHGYRELE